MQALKTHDASSKLGKIKCPRKVIGGVEDILFPPKLIKHLAEKLKVKPTIIDDFGHWGMGIQAHKFQKEIFDFFLE